MEEEAGEKTSARPHNFGRFGVLAVLLGPTIAGALIAIGGDSSGFVVVLSLVIGAIWLVAGGALGILGWRDTWGKLAVYLAVGVLGIAGFAVTSYFFTGR